MSRRPYTVAIAAASNSRAAPSTTVNLFAICAGVKSLLELTLNYVGEFFQEKGLSLAFIADMNVEMKQKLLEIVCAKNKLTQANVCIFLDTEIRHLNLLDGRGLNDGTLFAREIVFVFWR